MCKLFFKTFRLLAIFPLLITACGAGNQAQLEETALLKAVTYQTVLDKSLSDTVVSDFISSNHCSPAGQFQLCKEVGMALWIDLDQIVKTVWLYAGHAGGFKRYRGQLTYGLTFYDPLWRVEEKLGELEGDDSLQPARNVGVPDEGSSPDHMHYWAVYERFDMIVIYNVPVADEDAYIYAILVSS